MTVKTALSILQQSEYDLEYFQRWYKKHRSDKEEKEPEKWTPKLKLILFLTNLFFFLPLLSKIKVSLWIINPLDYLVKKTIISLAIAKLRLLQAFGLKIVAIAGSYAKTSTKHIIFHGLKSQAGILSTPKSVNTPLGIAQVILKDLSFLRRQVYPPTGWKSSLLNNLDPSEVHQRDDSMKPQHRVFLVELGEYYQGDIKNLCEFAKPNYGILSPIGRQHLERMGDFETITKTFQEMIDYFDHRPNDFIVSAANKKYYKNPKLNFYGDDISKVKISRAGTEFEIETKSQKPKARNQESAIGNRKSRIFIPLYGKHQAENASACFWLASKLGLDHNQLKKDLAALPHIPHRHEPFFAEQNVLILDNGYNSNPDSVKASLALINELEPTHRIIITPGFLELGKEAEKIHANFGKELAKSVDILGLIEFPGVQIIADNFLKSGGKKSNLFFGKSQEELVEKMQSKIIPGSVLLFENGVNEVYR